MVEPGQPSLSDRSSIYFIRQGVQIRDITILEVVLVVLLNYIIIDNLHLEGLDETDHPSSARGRD